MTPIDRLARAAPMAKGARDLDARQIIAEHRPRSDKQLKSEAALRVYDDEPSVRLVIEERLASLSD